MKNHFKIAQISAAHGIRGEVKLFCFLENPDDLPRYSPFSDKRGMPYNITVTGHTKDHLITRIEGVNDRNAAELLRGVELYAEAKKRAALAENEFYHQDLVGLPAVLENGEKVGIVTAIHNFGAGDIIEIKTKDDELLLPFKDPFVGEITAEKIIITLPEYVGEEDE